MYISKTNCNDLSVCTFYFCMTMAVLMAGIGMNDSLGVGIGYHVDGDILYIDNIDSDNPIILDNDWWGENVTDEFVYAKAALCQADLRGLIATRDMYGYPNMQYQHSQSMNELIQDVDKARQSGVTNIPDPTAGNWKPLDPPGDYVIEHTDYVASISDGSNLIVQQAHTASPDKPLLIIVGGALDTVATAYMQDPSIANNIVVYDTGGAYNDKSAWPWQICMERTKFIFWEDPRCWDWGIGNIGYESWLHSRLPDNPMTDYMEDRWADGRNIHWADWFLVAYMYGKDHFTNAKKMELEPFTGHWHAHETSGSTYDFIMIDDFMTNTSFDQTSSVDYWNTLSNPEVYDGLPCVDIIAPENVNATFVSFSQMNITWDDTNSGDTQETGHIIERRPFNGSDQWTEIGNIGPDITSYTDSNTTYGNVTYYYRVGAYK